MTMYLIANIEVKDDAWVPQYAEHVHGIVHKHGGKYLSRSGNITTVEGEPSTASIIALLAFPSMEAIEAFASDPAYAEFGAARQAGSVSTFHIIDDSDAAGTIPYLPKG